MISSIRWLIFGLLTLLVAALFAWRQYTHIQEVKSLRKEITQTRDTLVITRKEKETVEARERTTALAYAQVLIQERASVDSARRLPRTKPLPAQIIRVEAITGIRPRIPLPAYLSMPPSLSFSMQVCYDSTGHTNLLSDLEELEYRRARDSLGRVAYVRLSQRAAYSEGGLRDISQPGLFKRRKHKSKTVLREISQRWGELLYFLTP